MLRSELPLDAACVGGRIGGALLDAAGHLQELQIAAAAHAVRERRLRRLPLACASRQALSIIRCPPSAAARRRPLPTGGLPCEYGVVDLAFASQEEGALRLCDARRQEHSSTAE